MYSVLVIGNGGREHSIAWKLSQSLHVKQVFISPGNASSYSNSDVDIDDAETMVWFCLKNSIDLIVIGPEIALFNGLVNRINERIPTFGPCKEAARLESSKAFAKEFMQEFELPTAEYSTFDNLEGAKKFIERCIWNGIVVKSDGLCAGKGVIVADNKQEAIQAAEKLLQNGNIIVEEKLEGYEISALVFTDGDFFHRMPLIKDHKRLLEGDKGPNTGGMGVVGPIRVSEQINKEIDQIITKTIEGLKHRNIIYKGVLYAGLMITSSGAQLLEFNCRFGDPEAQILMRLLKGDLYDICISCINGTLSQLNIEWNDDYVCGIVLASKHYPESGDKGSLITGIPEDTKETIVFHAATKLIDGKVVTNGGRILCVTSVAKSTSAALSKALSTCDKIKFDGKYYRKDIGITENDRVIDEKLASNNLTYGDSGVDISEGNTFVEEIKFLVEKTMKRGMTQIGGFGALIDIEAAGFGIGGKGVEIVVGMDGVGTKIQIADAVGIYSGIGFDVVAMCVNDILCHCSQPIAFLDYYVCGRLDRSKAVQIIKSITYACIEANCSLIGGETAEMPGVYDKLQWDIAGCSIGVREKHWPQLPNTSSMEVGDLLIGLHSSGLHSNGFSLVRKIMNRSKKSYSDFPPWDEEKTFGEIMLEPTRIYVRQVLPLMKKGLVKGAAHITGGGIKENICRVLDKNGQLAIQVDATSWKKSELFNWLAGEGPIDHNEMLRTFNCGIGMVLVISPIYQSEVFEYLKACDENPILIGKVIRRQTDSLIEILNVEQAFNSSKYMQIRRKVKIGILISGTGSNMQKLIESSQRNDSNTEVVMVISNKFGVAGIDIAKSMNIPTMIIPHTKIREEGDEKIHQTLISAGVELICLAGYMRLLSPQFVKKWPGRIINIHPSLLPSFKGAHPIIDALQFGVKITGCTVHYVDEEIDHGPIISQTAVTIEDDDTELSLHQRVQQVEYVIYPQTIQKVAQQILNTTEI